MKNLFLFVVIATLTVFSSCSSDDKKEDQPNATSELKVTINGAQKTFNTIQVSQTSNSGTSFLEVTASINNNPAEIINFSVYNDGTTGANALENYLFNYTVNNKYYSTWNSNGSSNFSSIVQTNNNTTKKLVGTFTGTVYYNSGGTNESLNLTNGSFNISY